MSTTPDQPAPSSRRRVADVASALADRARAGDRAAFAELYQLTLDIVTRYVAVRMRERDRDAVGDLVHDAYCFALADPTLIGEDPVGSMLRLAARAVTRHQWATRRYLRAALTIGEAQHTARAPEPLGPATPALSETLTRMTFIHALAQLSPDQRRAIRLRHLDGYPREAAATVMGRTTNAVRLLERAALRRLHQQFCPTAGPATPAAKSPNP